MASETAVDLASLVRRARALITDDRRVVLGITGVPGSGKSYFAERLAAVLAASPPPEMPHQDWVCYLPMDGFHLAESQLRRLGRRQRKGAPDTFDGYGYACLLARIADVAERSNVIYAPTFDRTLEEPVAGSIPISSTVRLVITEGNYLLLPEEPWAQVAAQLAEVWYCDTEPARAMRQLVARHVRFGRSRTEALHWVHASDRPNADRIAAQRYRADVFIPDSTLLALADPGDEVTGAPEPQVAHADVAPRLRK